MGELGRRGRRSGPGLRGAAWMVAAMLFNTAELALVHLLGPGWPPPLQLFWRQGVALLVLLPMILADPATTLRVSRPGVMLFRSAAAMSALLLSIYAFSRLPIATANALSFTRPLWILLFAALLLGERVDRWRATAVIFGFAGVVVTLHPWAAGGRPVDLAAAAAALGSALLFALSFVSIKSMTGDNRTTTILTYGVLFGLLVSALPAWSLWRVPSLPEAACLAGLGIASLGGFGCFTQALRGSDAAALVSLDYLRLPLAALLGIAMFDEVPSAWLLAGGLMIAGASLSVTLRDRHVARRGRAPTQVQA